MRAPTPRRAPRPATPEGRILAFGIGMALLGAVGLVLYGLWAPRQSQLLAAMTATNVTFGRAAARRPGR